VRAAGSAWKLQACWASRDRTFQLAGFIPKPCMAVHGLLHSGASSAFRGHSQCIKIGVCLLGEKELPAWMNKSWLLNQAPTVLQLQHGVGLELPANGAT
jgi:hypothetical protein